MLNEARRLEENGDSAGALREYKVVAERFADGVVAPKALLAAAEIHRRLSETDAARSLFDQLVEKYPEANESAAAQVAQAEILSLAARNAEDVRAALTLVKRVVNTFSREGYPGLAARAEALTLAGQLEIQLGNLPAAAANLVEAIEDEPRSQQTPRARLALAETLFWQGDDTAALQLLQSVVDEAPDSTAAARARHHLASIDRLRLRPAAGSPIFLKGSTLALGTDVKHPRFLAAIGDTVVIGDGSAGLVTIDGAGKAAPNRSLRPVGRPWFDGAGELWVPIADALRSAGANRSLTFREPGDKPKDLEKIQAGARSAYGDWLLLHKGQGGILVYGRDLRPGRSLLGTSSVVDLDSDTRGRTYALVEKPSKVVVFDPERKEIATWSGSWAKPAAIATNELGYSFVLDGNTGRITILDFNGKTINTVGPTFPGGVTLRGAEDLAVDAASRLYVLDSKSEIVIRLE